MKTGLLLLYGCLGLLLASCGTRQVVPLDMAGKDTGTGRLLNISVQRWDTVRFSGLLGLRVNAAGLQYVLLDASGAKLLDVAVAGDGDHDLLRVSGPMKNTDFAPFLSEALARIYLQKPAGMGCEGSWFSKICREESEDYSLSTSGQAGPFTVWQSTSRTRRGGSGADADAVVYRQPWLGVRIYLEPTKLSP